MYVCIHIIWLYVHRYIYIYICTNIDTYIHIQTHSFLGKFVACLVALPGLKKSSSAAKVSWVGVAECRRESDPWEDPKNRSIFGYHNLHC